MVQAASLVIICLAASCIVVSGQALDLMTVCSSSTTSTTDIYSLPSGVTYTVTANPVSTTKQICDVTFLSSSGKFLVTPSSSSYISRCEIKVSILAGNTLDPRPNQLMKQYGCSDFDKLTRLVTSSYLTVRIDLGSLTTITNTDFSISIDVKGVDSKFTFSNTNTNTGVNSHSTDHHHGYTNWGSHHLTAGVLAAIIISAIISLLCCLAIPIGLCCYRRRSSRRLRDADTVVYTTDPMYPRYHNSYGQPAYMVKKV